jgi:hypothetical protein
LRGKQYQEGADEAKERISWLMGTVQQSLFPYLDECLPALLPEREKHLVKILGLIRIEK